MSGSYWAEELRASHAVPESKISWNSIQKAFYVEWLLKVYIHNYKNKVIVLILGLTESSLHPLCWQHMHNFNNLEFQIDLNPKFFFFFCDVFFSQNDVWMAS